LPPLPRICPRGGRRALSRRPPFDANDLQRVSKSPDNTGQVMLI